MACAEPLFFWQTCDDTNVLPMPQEGFCDAVNNGPFCVDRATFEAQYLVTSSPGGWESLVIGISIIVLASIISYKFYKANKRK
jgi:hypothetical protein